MITKRKPTSDDTSPVRLLFGLYHQRLLALLLLRPEQDFHLREIERLTGIPASSARRELQRFVRAGLVTSRRIGNQVRYQADGGSLVFEELASMMRKTVGTADILREALAPLADRIKLACVFGSVAKGEEGPHSDVDLLVVGEVAFEDIVEAMYRVHDRLRREVNPVVMSLREFARKRKARERFVTRVIAEPKLMLLGSIDES